MDLLKAKSFLVLVAMFLLAPSPAALAYRSDLDLEKITDEPVIGSQSPDGSKPAEAQAQAQENLKKEEAKVAESNAADKEKAKAEAKEKKDLAKKAAEEFDRTLCHSTQEYINTLKFMRNTQVILVNENTARLISDKVSKACDGGAERFGKVLTLLKTVGLSDTRALEIALDFSSRPLEVQKNFIEIFTKSFLGEFFDYDYRTAASLAFELSKDYRGDPVQVREDFIELVRFCKADDKLDLPARLCAEYSIKLARLTQFHPNGVRSSFYKLYERFRDDRTFAMDIRNSLELSYNILKFGPRAADNFFTAYDFAVSEAGLNLTQGASIEFSLRMASRSFKGNEPPLVPNLNDPVVVRNAASVR
jgi:hypothetical protein